MSKIQQLNNTFYDVLSGQTPSALADKVDMHHMTPIGNIVIDEYGQLYQAMGRHDAIVQIIPANVGTMAEYSGEGDDVFHSPIIAWGLTRGGDFIALDADSDGYVDVVNTADNFIGYIIPEGQGVTS